MTIDDIKELIKTDETRMVELKKTTDELKSPYEIKMVLPMLQYASSWLRAFSMKVGLGIASRFSIVALITYNH